MAIGPQTGYAPDPWQRVAASACMLPVMLAVLSALLTLDRLRIAAPATTIATVVYDLPPPAPPPVPVVESDPASAPTPGEPAIVAKAPVASPPRPAPIPTDIGAVPLVLAAPVAPPIGMSRDTIGALSGAPAAGVAADAGQDASRPGGAAGRDAGTEQPPAPVLTPASWVRRPSAADFRREWPRDGHGLAVPVHVAMLCSVRRNGHPFGCAVIRESLPDRGFGEAAIRLAERAVVRPVMSGGRSTDILVTVPLTFAVAAK